MEITGCSTNRMSDWEAGVSLAKAIMGAGSFALPWAFSKMGYVGGPIFLTIFLWLSVHSIGLLVDCACDLRMQLGAKRNPILSYVDVAKSTLGPKGAVLSYMASVSASIGVCGSYFVFVAVNLQSLVFKIANALNLKLEDGEIGVRALIWTVVLPISVLLSSIKDSKRFAKVSFWGDVSVVGGMLAVLAYGSRDVSSESFSSNREPCVALGSLENMALAFGSIGYLFLIHFLVLPIESSMVVASNPLVLYTSRSEDPATNTKKNTSYSSHQSRFQLVVRRTFLVCGVIGCIFGVSGYLLFGSDTHEIVLLNLETGMGMSIVQFLLCMDLILTYPIVMRPTISLLEDNWAKYSKQVTNVNKGGSGEDHVSLLCVDGSEGPSSLESVCAKRSASSTVSVSKVESWLDTSRSPSFHRTDQSRHSFEVETPTISATWQRGMEVERKMHMIVCWMLGVVAASAASFVPAFGLLSGLVGGVSQTFLAFVLPPIMWTQLQQHRLVESERQGSRADTDNFGRGSLFLLSCWKLLRLFSMRELALIICGIGLISWTLHSTLKELTRL